MQTIKGFRTSCLLFILFLPSVTTGVKVYWDFPSQCGPEWVIVVSEKSEADWIIEVKKWTWYNTSGDYIRVDFDFQFYCIKTGEKIVKSKTCYLDLKGAKGRQSLSLQELCELTAVKGCLVLSLHDFFRKWDKENPVLNLYPPFDEDKIIVSSDSVLLNFCVSDNKEVCLTEIFKDGKLIGCDVANKKICELNMNIGFEIGQYILQIVTIDWAGNSVMKQIEVSRVVRQAQESQQPLPSNDFAREKKNVEAASPKLTFSAELIEPNNNGILESYEEIEVAVTVNNEGKGLAKGVKVVLSGTSKVIEYLGKEKIIGDIPAGATKEIKFTATVPPNILPEEGTSIVVKVIESRPEWSCPDEQKFTVAVKPAPKKIGEEKTFIPVDIVPAKRWINPNAYGVIIGISDYQNIADVKYARKDAEKMKEYFINVLGIPVNHIYQALDNNAMKSEFEEIFETKIKHLPQGSFLAVYYAGHIAPKGEDSLSYLVPWEAEYNAERKTYSLKRLYEALNSSPAKDIVVFLDGCFSGESRSILAMNKRPLAISNINPEVIRPKFVVFAAAKEKQESNDYTTAKHGLFTYYLLRALKEGYDENGNGWLELGELYNYVSKNVSTTAGTELYTTQEPVILPDGALRDKSNFKIGKVR